MDMMTSNLQQQRIMVTQLRREAALRRCHVSEACKDIVNYVSEHQNDDCLLIGFGQKVNPFREKSSCTVL